MPGAAWVVTEKGATFGSEVVPLRGHALGVLAALVDHHELTLDELRRVWHSEWPSDEVVQRAVAAVNAALTARFRVGVECRRGRWFRLLVR